jgi:hypothetical protein
MNKAFHWAVSASNNTEWLDLRNEGIAISQCQLPSRQTGLAAVCVYIFKEAALFVDSATLSQCDYVVAQVQKGSKGQTQLAQVSPLLNQSVSKGVSRCRLCCVRQIVLCHAISSRMLQDACQSALD